MVLIFILIAIVVMLLTMMVVFRNQFAVQQKRVQNEYENLTEILNQRNEQLKQITRTLDEHLEGELEINKYTSELINSVNMLEQSVSMNDVISCNVAITLLAKPVLEYISDSRNGCESLFYTQLDRLSGIENELQTQTESFNSCVRLYNVSISIFPAKYVAKLMHLSKINEYKENK